MRVAVSIGDVAGIGPEVILGALREPLEETRVVLYGDFDALRRAVQPLESYTPETFASRFVRRGELTGPDDDRVEVVDVAPELEVASVEKGTEDERAARLQWRAFEAAVDAVMEDDADAVTTAPWNKSLFQHIGEPALGHTEVLDDRFPTSDPVMMLAGEQMRVSLVTTHVPIRRVARRLTSGRIREVVRTTVGGLRRRFGVERPTIAVCGLNPHSGEGGAMGNEERDLIEPTLETLRSELEPSVVVDGPSPSDTLFAKFRDGASPYDAVVCMYHDQGLIPLKLTHFGASANVTLGLPIVRTSVDHGTAYDIAGEGVAESGSMRYALELAVAMASREMAVEGGE